MEPSPISQVVTPRRNNHGGVAPLSALSASFKSQADSVDGGSQTPFRGRTLRESMPDEGPDSPTLKAHKRAANGGPGRPSAAPRKTARTVRPSSPEQLAVVCTQRSNGLDFFSPCHVFVSAMHLCLYLHVVSVPH